MALFSGNFQSNFSFESLLVAGSERLDSKVSLSKRRKTFKDQKKTKYQKKTFVCALQSGCSEKNENAREKCQNPASVTLICDFMVMELHHGHFLE